jgi:hypothetical protein
VERQRRSVVTNHFLASRENWRVWRPLAEEKVFTRAMRSGGASPTLPYGCKESMLDVGIDRGGR